MLPLHLFACPSCQSEEMQVLRDSSTALEGFAISLATKRAVQMESFKIGKQVIYPGLKAMGGCIYFTGEDEPSAISIIGTSPSVAALGWLGPGVHW